MRIHRRLGRQLYSLDSLEARRLLAATKLVFSNAALTTDAGSVSSTLTVQLQDASGNPAAATGDVVVNLSTSSNSASFVPAAAAGAISTITIPSGATSASVRYLDNVATKPTLTASTAGLTPAQQVETINATEVRALSITSNPVGPLANTNSPSVTLTLLDALGNVAVAPTGGVAIALSSTSGSGTFSGGTNVSIPAGSSTITFTYKDTIVGTPTISAVATNLSNVTAATQQERIFSATTAIVKPDSNGLGSYASTPPGGQNSGFVYNSVYDWINRPANSPLPTNDWWTLILKSGFAGSLYSMPQKLFTYADGVSVSGFTGTQSVNNNIGYSGEQVVTLGGATFTRDALVDYGDWNLRFRMEKAANQYVDVTSLQGSPMTWFEYNNISPTITFGAAGSYGTIFDGTGASLGNGGASFTADHFRITKAGVNFGVFAPPGTTFIPTSGGFSAAFAGSSHYIVLATLPDASNATFDNFYQHAYSIPRGTTYGYSYSATAGAVTTTWNITTEALKSNASSDVIQGWLPTNYRDIVSGPAIVSGLTWPTIYGTVRASLGHSFTIVQPSTGLNFVLPAPAATGGANDYNASKMAGWLSSFQLGTGGDSYGGQTTLSQAAQLTLMAKQMGDSNYTRLLNILRSGVTDWLTYQSGDSKFYTAYPKDGGLIAYPPAFGSDHYTDLHFHLGYLTSSAAVLAMLDPTWASNYGAIATLVAKSYANWDRSDTSEPWLRNFNPWKGHSYADGLGDSLGNQGNNQESVSEAVQSWQGLVLLGSVLNNQAMLDAGMMGYTMEAKAETEYWLNVAHQDLNPPSFPTNRNTAINADFTREAQTFFGTKPEYILGIEGTPNWPSFDFFGKYQTAMQAEIDATLAAVGGSDPWAVIGGRDDGNNWLGAMLGIQGQTTPQKAADQFARLATLNAGDNTNAITGIPYYITYANRTYGLRDFSLHLSVPVGGAYTSSTGAHTYVVYNSAATAQTIQVFNASGSVIETFTAAPRTTTVYQPFTTLVNGVLTVAGTAGNDNFALSQIGTTITASRGGTSVTYDSATVSSIVINGLSNDDTLDVNSTITVPVTFNGSSGEDTININAGTFTFAADAELATDNLSVNVNDGATAVFNTTQHLESLSVSGAAIVSAGGSKTLVVQGLGFAGSGFIDLTDNRMVVDYAGVSPLAATRAALAAGYAGGAWNGRGINSSTASQTAGRAIGYAESSVVFSAFPATFGDVSVDSSSILIAYTLAGDANLDRKVDFNDLVPLAQHYNSNGNWSDGDFNYSAGGTIDFNDLVILAQNYGASLTPPTIIATKADTKLRRTIASAIL